MQTRKDNIDIDKKKRNGLLSFPYWLRRFQSHYRRLAKRLICFSRSLVKSEFRGFENPRVKRQKSPPAPCRHGLRSKVPELRIRRRGMELRRSALGGAAARLRAPGPPLRPLRSAPRHGCRAGGAGLRRVLRRCGAVRAGPRRAVLRAMPAAVRGVSGAGPGGWSAGWGTALRRKGSPWWGAFPLVCYAGCGWGRWERGNHVELRHS